TSSEHEPRSGTNRTSLWRVRGAGSSTVRSTTEKTYPALGIDRILQSARANNRCCSIDVSRRSNSRSRGTGLRRTVSFFAVAARSTTRTDDLCDLPGDPPERDRILFGFAFGRHSKSRHAPPYFALALR